VVVTALEVLTAPIVTAQPRVQYDRARRDHEREALLAYAANRPITRLVQQETVSRVAQYGRTELHPTTADPALWVEPEHHDDNAREGQW
jgi:hypothetical protein